MAKSVVILILHLLLLLTCNTSNTPQFHTMAAQKKARFSKQKLIEEAANETTASQQETSVVSANNRPTKAGASSIQATCELIAETSESILEAPDNAFSSPSTSTNPKDENAPMRRGRSKMETLLSIARTQSTPEDIYTAQLAMMSLLAIFKDIIPSYRIRMPTKQEMAVRVSKDTKKLWDFERALLHHYQLYLKLLEKTWDSGKEAKPGPSRLAITSILSLCELLKTAHYFNFRSNLLTSVIRQMNTGLSAEVSNACCDAIAHVFKHDTQGEVAMEASRQVAKLIRDRGLRVQPNVLKTFLALPLRVHVDEAEAAKIATKANAKKRKRDKETAEIESEMKEGDAKVDKIILARCQSDSLQAITLTYFRILKSNDLNATHIRELLPTALEGLAKFAHLINIDTVMDLLQVLKELLKRVEELPLSAALNCILTAFQALQGPGREMKIDQKDYILPLYSQLPRLCSEAASREQTHVMIQCLNAAFVNRREYSTVRIAAFFKQILTVAMHTPPHTSVPLLAFARQLLQRYSSAQQMLENEQDVITSGEYTPEREDPEHTNPFATSAWELATLKFHFRADVATQALSAASLKILQLPSEDPDRLRKGLLEDEDDLYIPFNRVHKKHPLANREAMKRKQIRFIKPRQTEISDEIQAYFDSLLNVANK